MDTRKLRHWILIADLVWAAVALVIAYAMRYGLSENAQIFWRPFSMFGLEFVAALVIWVALNEWMGLDGFRGGWYLPAVFSRVLLALLTLMAVLLAAAYLARAFVSRLVLSYFAVLLLIGFVAIRWITQLVFKSKFATNARRRVVIVGSGHVARELGARIERHPEVLCTVVGYLAAQDTYSESFSVADTSAVVPVQTLGIVDLLKARGVQELILVGSSCSHGELINLAARCRNEGIHVSLVPELYELYLSKPNLLDLDGLPVLQLPEPHSLVTGGIKRAMDLALGSALLVPALPILLVAAACLRLEKGSAFRWEVRCGQDGKRFRMLRLNVDRFAPNLTFLQNILEDLSVTELPQIWNVLMGDMSLVGPRPEDPRRVERYTEWERQRLNAKPGMTGLAQVYGLREQHSSAEKCRFDLQYLLDCSPFLDLSLLLQTVWTLMTRSLHRKSLPTDSPLPPTTQHVPLIEEIVHSAHRTQSSAD
jgi:lipopolysaccharide/colanic/teichoic acid biosynthesis glycosyltransferase